MITAPNQRLQRTPSAAPPSPLSRKPLGPAKFSLGVRSGVILLATALLAYGAVSAGTTARSPTPARGANEKYLPRPGDFTIVCTLYLRNPPGTLSVPDVPITYDPKFLLGAKVDAVTLGKSPWKVGESLRFLIHSPHLLLGGQQFDGKQYSLTFSPFRPKTEDDKVWFKPGTRYLLKWLEPVR